MKRLASLIVAMLLLGCRTEQTLVTPDPHLNRMLDQAKRLPYQADPLLPRGMVMQEPPDGTLAVDTPIGRPLVTTGADHGHLAERVPVPIDRALLETGRDRFDVFCATCHGVLGDGVSVVAGKMSLRVPPDLLTLAPATHPPGEIFQTVRSGYGLMPSYAVQLTVDDTWAVVAYLSALRLSRGSRVADLPPDVRERLAREAP